MTSAVFDFAAINAGMNRSDAASRFEICDGPQSTLEPPKHNPRVSEHEPDYPAIGIYSAGTDELFWVECSDPHKLALAWKRNAAAETLPVKPTRPIEQVAADWARHMRYALTSLGISVCPAKNDGYEDRFGTQIRHGDKVYMLKQMHVDWGNADPENPQVGIEALAKAVAASAGESRTIKLGNIYLPRSDAGGIEACYTEFGPLCMRAMRALTLVSTGPGEHDVADIMLTRLDILFTAID